MGFCELTIMVGCTLAAIASVVAAITHRARELWRARRQRVVVLQLAPIELRSESQRLRRRMIYGRLP